MSPLEQARIKKAAVKGKWDVVSRLNKEFLTSPKGVRERRVHLRDKRVVKMVLGGKSVEAVAKLTGLDAKRIEELLKDKNLVREAKELKK